VIDRMAEQGLISKEKRGRAVLLEASLLGGSLLKAWRQEFHAIEMQLSNVMTEEPRVIA
jgi:predicted transcriptional regulator